MIHPTRTSHRRLCKLLLTVITLAYLVQLGTARAQTQNTALRPNTNAAPTAVPAQTAAPANAPDANANANSGAGTTGNANAAGNANVATGNTNNSTQGGITYGRWGINGPPWMIIVIVVLALLAAIVALKYVPGVSKLLRPGASRVTRWVIAVLILLVVVLSVVLWFGQTKGATTGQVASQTTVANDNGEVVPKMVPVTTQKEAPMPNLSILNTLIAMVIVILVLSLVVQSLQTLVKKFFKLKSNTIINSLEDLFETITQRPDGVAAAGGNSPSQLLSHVTDRLKEMGRKTLFGRPMLDSLAKGDLLKVLTRVEADNLLPGSVDKFQTVLGAIGELKDEFEGIEAGLLAGEASAKFAALQAAVMPLVNDIEALASGGKINPKVLLGDLYNLRQIKAAEVLDILGQIQQRVGEDLETARAADAAAQKALADAQKPGGEAQPAQEGANAAQLAAAQEGANEARGRLEGVTRVSDALKRIAEQLTALGRAFDAAFAPLRERLQQAEVWYDTVMQGFEERYTRHMRTVALSISIIVVVVLNANFFTIYQAMSNPQTAENVANQGQDVLKRSRQTTPAQDGAAAGQPTGTNATPTPPTSATPAQGGGAQTPPADGSTTPADLQKQEQEAAGWVDTYKSFGIKPLTRQQIKDAFDFSARPYKYTLHDLSGTFAGWIIMVILLSAGAPFWQDTLESLFGLKNLLRQRSDTKNVEGEKGGQPKP